MQKLNLQVLQTKHQHTNVVEGLDEIVQFKQLQKQFEKQF